MSKDQEKDQDTMAEATEEPNDGETTAAEKLSDYMRDNRIVSKHTFEPSESG